MPTPFVNRAAPPPKGEPLKNPDSAKIDDKTTKAIDGKPRFDFYKILPGSEEPVTEQQFKDAQKKGPLPAEATESFYLQAGAFQNAPDADHLKARLALIGVAERYLNRDHRLRPMLTEAVFPFYLVHQTIIIVVMYGNRRSQPRARNVETKQRRDHSHQGS